MSRSRALYELASGVRHAAAIFQVPGAWLRGLSEARILLNGRWHRYMGFRPKNALNCFFYRTQWLNIERYGRNGISPVLGLGSYPLSRWFHLSSLSSYVYSHAGATTMLGGTLLWAANHLLWLEASSPSWVVLVVLTLMFGTTAYAMAFVRQNYNIVGWLWLPAVMYGILSGQLVIAAFALFAASLASITVVAVSIPIIFVLAIMRSAPELLLVLAPAVLKLVLHLLPLLKSGGLSSAAQTIGKLIGVIQTNVRYRRSSMRFGRFNIYFLSLYLGVCGALWVVENALPYLPLTAAGIFVLNQRLVRFADDQSVIMLFVTVHAAHALAGSPGILQWVLLFMVANPVPRLFGIVDRNGRIEVYPPFDHSMVEQKCDVLFASVPAGGRVLFAFDDPDGIYERLFDGYRILLEPLQYVAARREIHLFPDWYAVSETNFEGAPPIWGRTLPQVLANLEHWNAEYVLYYHASGTQVAGSLLAKLEPVATFDWATVSDQLTVAPPWSLQKGCPQFTLLHLPAAVS